MKNYRGYNGNQVKNAESFDRRIAQDTINNKPEEKGYSRMLNLLGVRAYYYVTKGISLEEQSFPTSILTGLEIDPREARSFEEGLARGKRLASFGKLEEEVKRIEELIEALINNVKTR